MREHHRLLLLIASVAAASSVVAASAAGTAGTLFSATVFAAGEGEGGGGCYRIPAVIGIAPTTANPNGTLLVFAERRFLTCADDSPHSIALRRSLDGGRSWLPQQELASSHEAGASKTLFVGSPILERETGSIMMVIGHGGAPLLTKSTDRGASWSPPRSIFFCLQGAVNPGPGAGVQLSSGRLVVPVQTSNCNNNDTTHAGAMYSDDGGKTWRISAPVLGPGETQIALTSRNTLLTIGHGNRKTERYQMFAESVDGGGNWSAVRRASDLVNVGCQQAMISAVETDGRHFLYYTAPHGILLALDEFDEVTMRRDGIVKYSQDDGRSWWLLEPAELEAGPFMYYLRQINIEIVFAKILKLLDFTVRF